MTWRQFFLTATALLLSLLALFIWAWSTLPDGRLHLWFLDVGQGDAALARLPAGEWVLIDGGPDSRVLDHLGRLMPFYEREIELVILTHPHADHVDGLVEVLARYRVKNLLLTGVKYDYVAYDRLLELAEQKGVKLLYTTAGRDFVLGRAGIDVLYPGKEWRGKAIGNVNNSSLVFRLIYGDWRGFFSGDMEIEEEEVLLEKVQRGLVLSADLLKAAHHGSNTSNSPALVEAVSPAVAVISCGVDNQFKHPGPLTLETFSRAGMEARRTDLEGTVDVVVPFISPPPWRKVSSVPPAEG